MSEQLLEIHDLSVEYRANREIVKAVNGIDLSIQKGESLGLVGETGAGKTSTALSILRLLPKRTGFVTSGSITLDGADIYSLSESEMRMLRGVGASMIFQDPMTSLNPVLEVGEQIAEVLIYHNIENKSKEQIESRVDELLEMVGIPKERKHEYPHQFSGGMKQRIGIAMALACEPKLLIADEPTTALDVTIQAQVLQMMDKLRKKFQTAVLLITHVLGVVARMCQKVAVMYAGEIIESGTAQDIYKGDKHHPYTKGLFNSIPKLDSREQRLTAIPGMMPDPTNLPKGCSFCPRCSEKLPICETTRPPLVTDGTHCIRCHLYAMGKEGNNETTD